MICADGVTVRYGRRAVLDRVDIVVRPGHITGIVGPNGSGKSTLLRALVGAVRTDAGTITIDGDDLRALSRRELARRTAFLGQHPVGDVALTAADEVALAGIARGRGGRPFDRTVIEALDAVGLVDQATSPLRSLSGGERQRVALARALAQGADYALLDEPTNPLDIRHRLELTDMLHRIAPTVVVVLHDLDLAARVCDHVVVLDHGHIHAAGEPEAVLVSAVLDPVYAVNTESLRSSDGSPTLHFSLPRHERTPT